MSQSVYVRSMSRYERCIRWLVWKLDEHAQNIGDRAWDRHYNKQEKGA